jgi:thioredoxin 1
MSAIRLNDDNFNRVRDNEGVSLLDFYADWCGPCRMVLPIVDEIAKEREDLLVGKINVNDNPDLAKEFGVMSIPTLIVMKDGKIVNRVSGAKSKSQILDLVKV